MPLRAWHTVSGSPWFLSVKPLGRLRHCPRSGPLSAVVQNLLVNGLIAAVRQVVQLFSSSARSPGQLHAGSGLMAESLHDLQVALDAVASWARKWLFTSGIGPTKSAAMVFGAQPNVPSCSSRLQVHLYRLSWRHSVCSTLRCDVGRGSLWVGRLVLPSHLSSWSLVGQMLNTSPLVGCCFMLVRCTQCLRATDVHFLL